MKWWEEKINSDLPEFQLGGAARDNTNINTPPIPDFEEVAPLEPWAGRRFRVEQRRNPSEGTLREGPTNMQRAGNFLSDLGTDFAYAPRTIFTLERPTPEEYQKNRGGNWGNRALSAAEGATYGMGAVLLGAAVNKGTQKIAAAASEYTNPTIDGFISGNPVHSLKRTKRIQREHEKLRDSLDPYKESAEETFNAAERTSREAQKPYWRREYQLKNSYDNLRRGFGKMNPMNHPASKDFIGNNYGYYLDSKGMLDEALMNPKKFRGNESLVNDFSDRYSKSLRGVILPENSSEQTIREALLTSRGPGAKMLGEGNYSSNSNQIMNQFSTPNQEGMAGFQGELRMNLISEGRTPEQRLDVIKYLSQGSNDLIAEGGYGAASQRRISSSLMDSYQGFLKLDSYKKVLPEIDPNINLKKGYQGLKDMGPTEGYFVRPEGAKKIDAKISSRDPGISRKVQQEKALKRREMEEYEMIGEKLATTKAKAKELDKSITNESHQELGEIFDKKQDLRSGQNKIINQKIDFIENGLKSIVGTMAAGTFGTAAALAKRNHNSTGMSASERREMIKAERAARKPKLQNGGYWWEEKINGDLPQFQLGGFPNEGEGGEPISKTYSPVIKQGTNIKALQRFLNESYPQLSQIGEKLNEDGVWGDETHRLYEKFKTDNPKSDGQTRRNVREAAPVTGFLESFFPGAMTPISALADDVFRKQVMNYGPNSMPPIRTEGDFTGDQMEVLRQITRKNLSEGKTNIGYPDYEALRPHQAYGGSGVKTAKALLTDPGFQTQSSLGRTSIVVTPTLETSEPDTLVLDTYNFNDDAYAHLDRGDLSATDKIKEAKGKAQSSYGFARNMAQYFGSQEGDKSGKKYAIRTNQEERPGFQLGGYKKSEAYNAGPGYGETTIKKEPKTSEDSWWEKKMKE